LQGDITDTDTGQDIPQIKLIEVVKQYARLIEVFYDMEAIESKPSMVTLTYQEYLMLPATFIAARRVFKNVLAEMKNKKK
jgi:hypothetical protein